MILLSQRFHEMIIYKVVFNSNKLCHSSIRLTGLFLETLARCFNQIHFRVTTVDLTACLVTLAEEK